MVTTSLDDVIAGLPLPVLGVDPALKIVGANHLAHELLGHHIENRHFLSAVRQPALVAAVEDCLRHGAEAVTRYTDRKHDGETLYDVTVSRSGTLALLSFQDVTPLNAAEKMRRDFVANVSHELRTPLTSLLGFIETLRGPARDDAPVRERFLAIMNNEAERMNRLIDDLLSLTRVEEDARVRPAQRVDFSEIVSRAERSLTPIALEAEVTLVPATGPGPFDLPGDADQLLQVVTNLLVNAVKYGGSGKEVEISLQRNPDHPAVRGPAVILRVTDQGPGIAPEHIPRLTERFYRVDDHRSRAVGGTGLGLAIVKHIVSRHRGILRIESTVGLGSSFEVILPQQP